MGGIRASFAAWGESWTKVERFRGRGANWLLPEQIRSSPDQIRSSRRRAAGPLRASGGLHKKVLAPQAEQKAAKRVPGGPSQKRSSLRLAAGFSMSNEYTLAHSVAGALHCHGGRCRDGPTDSLLPGVKCQTRQLGAQGFWFLFFSFLLPSRRAHAACKRRRTPRVCCGDHAHVHAHEHDEQRPQPRSPTLPPVVRWLGEKASPVGKHRPLTPRS